MIMNHKMDKLSLSAKFNIALPPLQVSQTALQYVFHGF